MTTPLTAPAIRVLLVDDDPLALELHRAYLDRVGGFEVVESCGGARLAIEALTRLGEQIELVLLDVTMPDGSGLDVLRHARARGFAGDVIAVSGVRDAETVRQMVAFGSVHYLIKPFTYAMFRDRMQQFRDYHHRAVASSGPTTQTEVDALLAALRPSGEATMPKGLSEGTLTLVSSVVRERGSCSASEAADVLGLSREVSRRYLEYLADAGRVERAARYGVRGRPQTEYRWNVSSAS